MEKFLFYYPTIIGNIGIEASDLGVHHIYFTEQDLPYQNIETELIRKTCIQLDEYFEGKRIKFELPLICEGTKFQKEVWNKLIEIPYGETRSYQNIAIDLNNPNACRAVGMANNKNPIPIIIPCHRVIGKNGTLVGYAGGLDIKNKLLTIEGKSII